MKNLIIALSILTGVSQTYAKPVSPEDQIVCAKYVPGQPFDGSSFKGFKAHEIQGARKLPAQSGTGKLKKVYTVGLGRGGVVQIHIEPSEQVWAPNEKMLSAVSFVKYTDAEGKSIEIQPYTRSFTFAVNDGSSEYVACLTKELGR